MTTLKEYDEWKFCIGNIIECCLEQDGKSYSWLAREVGVSATTVSRWVKGESYPSLAMWSHIREALDIPEEDDDFELDVPKVVYYDPTEIAMDNDYHSPWFCPNCNSPLEWVNGGDEIYCKQCGQRVVKEISV